MLKAGEWAGLPTWLVGVIAIGAISAAFSTVSGLLITGAGAFSYDIYCRFLNPKASERNTDAGRQGRDPGPGGAGGPGGGQAAGD